MVKNLGENVFYHLSQEFNSNVLYLLNKNRFFPYDYWDSFEKFKKGLPRKNKFSNALTNNFVSDKS